MRPAMVAAVFPSAKINPAFELEISRCTAETPARVSPLRPRPSVSMTPDDK